MLLFEHNGSVYNLALVQRFKALNLDSDQKPRWRIEVHFYGGAPGIVLLGDEAQRFLDLVDEYRG